MSEPNMTYQGDLLSQNKIFMNPRQTDRFSVKDMFERNISRHSALQAYADLH